MSLIEGLSAVATCQFAQTTILPKTRLQQIFNTVISSGSVTLTVFCSILYLFVTAEQIWSRAPFRFPRFLSPGNHYSG